MNVIKDHENRQECTYQTPNFECINGYLYDLDNCDDSGLLTTGDEIACPKCNPDGGERSL